MHLLMLTNEPYCKVLPSSLYKDWLKRLRLIKIVFSSSYDEVVWTFNTFLISTPISLYLFYRAFCSEQRFHSVITE